MPKPKQNESNADYIQRCMSDSDMTDKYPDEAQRYAVCESIYKTEMANVKVSFDYDGVLSTSKGKELAKKEISNGNTVYIISARNERQGMLSTAKDLGISMSRVFATGSNKAKIEKIKELNISIHYDNNSDVINELKGIGKLF